jgi:ParB family chromosome partitioning protein
MNPNTTTEYRNLPLNVLTESTTNPRRIFSDVALKELAESIRVQGVLSPLLVRPLTGQNFEIVAGARRYRAAQIAEAATVPVRIVTDAIALKVKHEFAAKEKARSAVKIEPKPVPRALKKIA